MYLQTGGHYLDCKKYHDYDKLNLNKPTGDLTTLCARIVILEKKRMKEQ